MLCFEIHNKDLCIHFLSRYVLYVHNVQVEGHSLDTTSADNASKLGFLLQTSVENLENKAFDLIHYLL